MLVGLGLKAFAALIAGFGLLMLELAAYFALVQIYSAILAAAILGVVNFVVAACCSPSRRGPLPAANSNLPASFSSAIDALHVEARALQSQVNGMIHHPLNGVLPMLLVPLITIIIKSLKRSKASAPTAAATAAAKQK
jgi:hypothetical protein